MATPNTTTNTSSIEKDTLNELAKMRLEEANILLNSGHFSGAAYLSGYAIELKLKSKICERFNWSTYPPPKVTTVRASSSKELSLDCLKVHDLRGLTYFAGIRSYDASGDSFIPAPRSLTPIELTSFYNTVITWSEVKRYQETNELNACKLVKAVEEFFKYLNE